MFRVIGVQPQFGHVFSDAEYQVDNDAPAVLISDRFRRRHFNGDRNVSEKTLILDKTPTTTINAVMPLDFNFFDNETDLWGPQPLGHLQVQSKQGYLVAIVRLKPRGLDAAGSGGGGRVSRATGGRRSGAQQGKQRAGSIAARGRSMETSARRC
jgi:hypothetical protein